MIASYRRDRWGHDGTGHIKITAGHFRQQIALLCHHHAGLLVARTGIKAHHAATFFNELHNPVRAHAHGNTRKPHERAVVGLVNVDFEILQVVLNAYDILGNKGAHARNCGM